MTRKLINAVAFYAGWFVCVSRHDWVGPAFVAWVLVPTLWFAADRATELRTIGLAVLFGLVADTALEQAGFWTYAGGPRIGPLCPLWIVALWALFGSTLHVALAFLARRPWLGAVFGAAGGPLTYLLAERLGGITLHGGALVAVGVEYAIAVPLLYRLAPKPAPSRREVLA